MKLLNNDLSTNCKPILFCFPPVKLPIDNSGAIVNEGVATDYHFASVVYDVDENDFRILEFNKKVKSALVGYNQRHKRLEDLEVLLYRDANDKRFRITLGNPQKKGLPFSNKERAKAGETQQSLYSEYMNKPGHFILDRSNG